jgi:hypothetical protein
MRIYVAPNIFILNKFRYKSVQLGLGFDNFNAHRNLPSQIYGDHLVTLLDPFCTPSLVYSCCSAVAGNIFLLKYQLDLLQLRLRSRNTCYSYCHVRTQNIL